MTIKYIMKDDYLDCVMIDDQIIKVEDDDFITVPKLLLKNLKLREIKKNIPINVCESIQEDCIMLGACSYQIKKINNHSAEIIFEDSGRRKYWDANVGFKKYMEAKRHIISEREKELKDIKLLNYHDDGDYIFLYFSTIIQDDFLINIVQKSEQLYDEIEGTTDLALGSPFKKISDTNSEVDFTISILIPLLRKLGFTNVKYNHGTKEYGKDIVFARKTEFDDLEFYGVQVKYGDVSGSAKSDIDELISQADDAFKMPFYDIYTRTQQRISKLIFAISGRFTGNAVEKICEKIESHSLKNNIIFIDEDKINSLSEKFKNIYIERL